MPLVIESTGSAGLRAIGFQQVTVSTAALALTIPPGMVPKRALVSVEGQPIRYRYDGATPTSGQGHVALAATELELIGSVKIAAFRMIRQGSDATVTYSLQA